MLHESKGLALGLKASDDLCGVHAGLDDLERHTAVEGLSLLRHEDHAHAAFAELLEQLVWTDDRSRAILQGEWNIGRSPRLLDINFALWPIDHEKTLSCR